MLRLTQARKVNVVPLHQAMQSIPVLLFHPPYIPVYHSYGPLIQIARLEREDLRHLLFSSSLHKVVLLMLPQKHIIMTKDYVLIMMMSRHVQARRRVY